MKIFLIFVFLLLPSFSFAALGSWSNETSVRDGGECYGPVSGETRFVNFTHSFTTSYDYFVYISDSDLCPALGTPIPFVWTFNSTDVTGTQSFSFTVPHGYYYLVDMSAGEYNGDWYEYDTSMASTTDYVMYFESFAWFFGFLLFFITIYVVVNLLYKVKNYD